MSHTRLRSPATTQAPAPANEILAAWPFPSSGGSTTYETLLWGDGRVTCNCPGWCNKKPDKPRSCRHVREVAPWVPRLLAGEITPSLAGAVRSGQTSGPAHALSPTRTSAPAHTPAPDRQVSALTGRRHRRLDVG